MKRIVLAALAIMALAPLAARADDSDAKAKYDALLAQAKSGAGPVDWAALRYAYADQPDYFGTLDDDDRTTMFDAASRHDWPGALAAALKVEDATWFDGGAHVMAAIAQSHLGHADAAAKEQAMADGIFASIKTGDGLKPETAFTVIAVSEEYDLLAADMNVDVKSQALSHVGDHSYDVMTVADANGKEVTYYFNIDREWAAEGRMFSGLGN